MRERERDRERKRETLNIPVVTLFIHFNISFYIDVCNLKHICICERDIARLRDAEKESVFYPTYGNNN